MDINQLKQTDFGEQFGRLFSQINHHYQVWAKRQGINYNQLAVLETLFHQQSATQKQICELWMVPKQTISTICTQYIAEGVLMWAASEDKREKRLSLTDRGRELAQPIMQQLAEVESAIFREFGDERSRKLLAETQAMESLFRRLMG